MQLANSLLIVVLAAGLLTGGCARRAQIVTLQPGVVTTSYVAANGERLHARFDQAANFVTVWPPHGDAVTLPRAISASGARYSDGSRTFWEHQGEASYWQGATLIFKGPLAQ